MYFCATHRKIYPLSDITPAEKLPPGGIAVHLHLYYLDLIDEFYSLLSHIPFPYDLYISITDASAYQRVLEIFSRPGIGKIKVAVVQNRGRDIAPMLAEFGAELSAYALFLHIHSKKSPHLNTAFNWRRQLLSNLLCNETHIRRIFKLFEMHPELGILYPETHPSFPYWTLTTLVNEPEMRRLYTLIHLDIPDIEKYIDFPAGTMFWARGAALKTLLCSNISFEEFPEERGQLDGTLAHAVERSLCLIASKAGYSTAQIDADFVNIGDGMRGLTPYLNMNASDMEAYLRRFKHAVFDVFGALLCSSYKNDRALWRNVEERLGHPFAHLREQSEKNVSHEAPCADIHAIYLEYRRLSGLSGLECEKIKALEFELLADSCRKRAVVAGILSRLISHGYDTVAVADGRWPRSYIERLLDICEIPIPTAIYLCCEYGLYKHDGGIYGLLTSRFGGKPFVIVGDHELDDILVPGQRGIPAFHVMNPHDMLHIARLDTAYFNRCCDDPFCLMEIMREKTAVTAEHASQAARLL